MKEKIPHSLRQLLGTKQVKRNGKIENILVAELALKNIQSALGKIENKKSNQYTRIKKLEIISQTISKYPHKVGKSGCKGIINKIPKKEIEKLDIDENYIKSNLNRLLLCSKTSKEVERDSKGNGRIGYSIKHAAHRVPTVSLVRSSQKGKVFSGGTYEC